MNVKERLLIRIKKLMKHAESAKALGSLAEAETFSQKVSELLIEYNLTMAEVAEIADKDDDEFAKWIYGEDISYRDKRAGSRWRFELVGTLCNNNFCNFTYNSQKKTFRVYGRMENVDTVVWLYNYLSIGLFRIAEDEFTKLNPMEQVRYGGSRKYQKDFLLGAVVGIGRKFKKQKEENERAGQINALMVVNKEALKRFITQQDLNLKTVKQRTVYVGAAYSKGVEAGEKYNINKPLSGKKTEIKKLK